MSVKDLASLFEHTLRDVYFAEKHIYKSLPKMIKNVTNADLKSAFEGHREETKEHIARLEKVFEAIGKKPKAEKCPAIIGITDEAEELIEEIKDKETLDAALIAAAQAVEHYEIARYGTLCVWASQLGNEDAKNLLEDTLSEEKDCDSKLTQLAESEINEAARTKAA